MGKADIVSLKRITTINLAKDIKEWISAQPERSEKVFAAKAGISPRTLQYITSYKGGAKEPNWTRKTYQGIMNVLEREGMY